MVRTAANVVSVVTHRWIGRKRYLASLLARAVNVSLCLGQSRIVLFSKIDEVLERHWLQVDNFAKQFRRRKIFSGVEPYRFRLLEFLERNSDGGGVTVVARFLVGLPGLLVDGVLLALRGLLCSLVARILSHVLHVARHCIRGLLGAVWLDGNCRLRILFTHVHARHVRRMGGCWACKAQVLRAMRNANVRCFVFIGCPTRPARAGHSLLRWRRWNRKDLRGGWPCAWQRRPGHIDRAEERERTSSCPA